MELCPACGEISNMVATEIMRIEADIYGGNKRIRTISFHCERCHRFVRSKENQEVAGE